MHGGRVLSISGSCVCVVDGPALGVYLKGGSWGEVLPKSAALVTWTLGNRRRDKTFDLH